MTKKAPPSSSPYRPSTKLRRQASFERSAAESASLVRMVQVVSPSATLDGFHLDMGALLRFMDIATCAAAEKHSRVNCVTVAMGDVVVENVPIVGDLLVLVAEPVLAGNTSLEIALTVSSERGDERRMVCEAFFTYVTTRGATGEKQQVPPLAPGSSEHVAWAKRSAAYRKALLAVESKANDAPPLPPRGGVGVFECTEVVLPAHQNHMGHTFGGVVMDWMSKAALMAACRHAKVPAEALTTLGIHRVSFPCGSGVSDHLVFRAQLNAVFEGGATCEVCVSAVKKAITTGEEVPINVGYFILGAQEGRSGSGSGSSAAPKTVAKGVARLFPALAAESSASDDAAGRRRQIEAAEWRRRLFVARRQLLTNEGGVLEWHPAVAVEASRVTIDAARRLLYESPAAAAWQACEPAQAKTRNALALQLAKRAGEGSADSPSAASSGAINGSSFVFQWASGHAWGRSSFVLRAALFVPMGKENAFSVETALATVRDRRPLWDESCIEVSDPVESSSGGGGSGGGEGSDVAWDVIEQRVRTPTAAVLLRCLRCSGMHAEERFILLRAWRIQGGENGGAGGGNDSGNGGEHAVFASRSVVHGKRPATADVSPACWCLKRVEPKEPGEPPALAIEYAVEFPYEMLRQRLPGCSDTRIVSTIAGIVAKWFVNLPGVIAAYPN